MKSSPGRERRRQRLELKQRSRLIPGKDRITIGELAERLKVAHHSAVGLVDRLAAHDLLAREIGEEDRRQVYVALTARGNEILQAVTAAHKMEIQRLAPQFRTLLRALARGQSGAD